jgi:hypothetical protein
MKKIKKNVLLFVTMSLLTSVTIVSCATDDVVDILLQKPSIIGKWEYSKTGTLVNGAETNLVDYTHATACSKDIIEFRLLNTGETTTYSNATSPCLEQKVSFAYTLEEPILVIVKGQTATNTYRLLSLTATELKYSDNTSNQLFVFKRI